ARYRYGPGVFKLDWALSNPIPWLAHACRMAGTVHVGGSLVEIASAEAAAWEGTIADRPFVLVTQPPRAGRAPRGVGILPRTGRVDGRHDGTDGAADRAFRTGISRHDRRAAHS